MDAAALMNAQPWHFVVITDRAMLDAIPDIHPHAAMCHELKTPLSAWPRLPGKSTRQLDGGLLRRR